MYYREENGSANFFVQKAQDSAGAELIPSKDTSPSSETSLAKIHDPVEESIEKESLTNSQTDNTEPTASEDPTTILESQKINVPSSENDCANFSAEQEKEV